MFYTPDTENCRPLQEFQTAKKADTRTNRIQQFIEMLEKNEKPHHDRLKLVLEPALGLTDGPQSVRSLLNLSV